jgi:hypothetical protein
VRDFAIAPPVLRLTTREVLDGVGLAREDPGTVRPRVLEVEERFGRGGACGVDTDQGVVSGVQAPGPGPDRVEAHLRYAHCCPRPARLVLVM